MSKPRGLVSEQPFDDGRGAFPDRIITNLPRGWRRQLKDVAQREGVNVSEFVRRALVVAAERAWRRSEGASA